MSFDYFYNSETRQFQFYSIPQMLFTEERFKKLSCEAKVLYGLLLDRSGLSAKNGWIDESGRVYVYFKNMEICEMLGCQGQKAVKIMKELDVNTGIGLIERKKQGQGKPDRIYVRHFNRVRSEMTSNDAGRSSTDCNDNCEPESSTSESQFLNCENHNSQSLTCENHNPGVVKITTQEFRKSQSSIKNHTKRTILSESYLSNPSESAGESQLTTADRMDEIGWYTQLVKENIEYDSCLIYDYEPKKLDELVALMVECITSTAPSIRVAAQDIPQELVKNQMLKLDCTHIQYVLDSLAANTSKIRNIKAYLITTLYNAPSTISNYYAARVQHDMPSLASN